MKTVSALQLPHRFAVDGRAVSALDYAILVTVGIAGAPSLFFGNVTTAIDTLGAAVGVLQVPAIPSLTP